MARPISGSSSLAEEKGKPVLDEKAQARFRRAPEPRAGALLHGRGLGTPRARPSSSPRSSRSSSTTGRSSSSSRTTASSATRNPDLPDEILFRIREDRQRAVRTPRPDGGRERRPLPQGPDVLRLPRREADRHGDVPRDLQALARPATARKKDRSWIPGFCARCHSSSEFMRSYNPKLPVDQLAKYRTSRHGELLLEKKDSKAAQCISCHGVHGIRGPDSPVSLVYPENIPTTCGRCHADAAYMKGYTLADGKTPLPTNQLEQYRKSVHGIALLEEARRRGPGLQRLPREPRRPAAPDGLRLAGLPELPRGQRDALRRQPAQEGVREAPAGPNAPPATTTT